MNMRMRRFGGALAVAGLALSGCATAEGAAFDGSANKDDIATVEPAGPAGGLPTVSLAQSAAARLGITTDLVRTQSVQGIDRLVIPYAAVIYDPTGQAFAYSSPRPREYQRVPLVIDDIQGDLALLDQGPAPGTQVVTVGASELLGTETGVGGE
jgi:hypothetical protein